MTPIELHIIIRPKNKFTKELVQSSFAVIYSMLMAYINTLGSLTIDTSYIGLEVTNPQPTPTKERPDTV
jgi:hypothetical protein